MTARLGTKQDKQAFADFSKDLNTRLTSLQTTADKLQDDASELNRSLNTLSDGVERYQRDVNSQLTQKANTAQVNTLRTDMTNLLESKQDKGAFEDFSVGIRSQLKLLQETTNNLKLSTSNLSTSFSQLKEDFNGFQKNVNLQLAQKVSSATYSQFTDEVTADISALQGKSNRMSADISALQTKSDKLSTDVSTLQTKSGQLSRDISLLQRNSTQFSKDISTLKSTSTQLSKEINRLDGSITRVGNNTLSIRTDLINAGTLRP
jgi:predicted  nucleic acid-binding Zn-ribbon protein